MKLVLRQVLETGYETGFGSMGEMEKMGVNGPKIIIMDKSHPKTMALRGWLIRT